MVGRLRTPYSAFRSGTSPPSLKRSRFRYPLAFILSSLILLLSASAFPFETLCRIAFRIPYSLFPIVFAAFFIMGTSLLAASANHLCQSLRLSSLHGLFQISFASSFSAQHWLVSFICARSHISFSCRDSVIHLSLYCHRKRFLLPGVGFQQGGADVHSDGFYQLPRPVASPHGSGQRRFSQPHWVSGYALLLYSPRSCPLRAF
ncbi:Uncharacterised protein [Kluyvera cryocrescens]|uniref:Uncharacterized protein n=1 Tax=Kluyvera cryocrescens TaxID=580 RepID=A0A485C262_KLUCR|nr:Uncharacterised protein [Kluyvera cryocrescens]